MWRIFESQYRTGVGYGTIGYHYDLAGRPGAHVWPVAPAPSGGVPKTTEVRYTYNMAGGLAGLYIDGAATPLALYGYNDAGQVELITLENGTSVLMTYDGTYGRLASLVNRDKTYQTMTGFEYTYNTDGYVTQVERENGDTIDYQYDGVGRLMDEWRRTGGAALVYRNRFQYDAVGNRTQWIADTPGDATTYNYTYNTLNQLTQRYWTKASVNYTEDYTYDLNGNLTQKDEKTATVLQLRWEYGWDDEDRLVSVVKKNGGGTVLLTVEYAYCPACGGNRTQKRVWNGTKMDQNLVKWSRYETEGLNQLRVDEKWESQTDGNNYLDALDPWRTVRVSYNGPGQIQQLLKEDVYTYASQTTSTPSNVTSIYYNYDRMGVVAGLSNVAGSELEQFESDAFGSWDGQNTYTTRRITGKEYDEDVQLYFFHARWYGGQTAQFLRRDANGCLGGGWWPDPLYSFVRNSPVAYVDPNGSSYKAPGPMSDEVLNNLKALCDSWKKMNNVPFLDDVPAVKGTKKGLDALQPLCEAAAEMLSERLCAWTANQWANDCAGVFCSNFGDPVAQGDCVAQCSSLQAYIKSQCPPPGSGPGFVQRCWDKYAPWLCENICDNTIGKVDDVLEGWLFDWITRGLPKPEKSED